jgi:hypothetical protein
MCCASLPLFAETDKLELVMATKLPTAPIESQGACTLSDLGQGACAEFVKFCKEQHLKARSAETFIRVLHNRNWQAEVSHIRDAMRPEVDAIFLPIEKALLEGANCREVMAKVVKALQAEETKK